MNQLCPADDSQLRQLLFGAEDDLDHAAITAHVETCADCQAKLDTLSGAGGFDAEARRMLTGFSQEDADLSQAEIASLGTPTHPEMLGRLGRYEVERVIGRGGMGVVFKGFDTELHRPVALKVLARHLASNGTARQRFAREAKAAAAVVHDHVLAIHNVEADGDTPFDTPFLVMPYVAGESLQARVEREGPLDAKEVLRIGIQAAAGLQAAHDQGLVHRDVKPGNVLLEGGLERALVTDFGLAQTVDDASLTHTGMITGTPNYMSPEQATGRPVDRRSDLFSLGCVLYFMATGRPPFRAEKAMGVLHRVCHEPHTPVWRQGAPDGLSDTIDRLLEKDPADRFSSAADTQRALERTLADLQHPQPRRLLALRRSLRRHRKRLRAGGLAAGGLLLMSVLVVTAQTTRTPSEPPAAKAPPQPADPGFSLSTWRQASSEEAQAWDNSIRQLSEQLRRVDPAASPAPLTPSPWQNDLYRLRQQLQQLENQDAGAVDTSRL